MFGSLSASFTFEEKNKVWDDLASRLSALHGTVRNKDDVIKKWSNLLSKHKPLIADKIASRNKTGGGPPGSALTPLEDLNIFQKFMFWNSECRHNDLCKKIFSRTVLVR